MSQFVGLLEWTFTPEWFFDGHTWTAHTDIGPILFKTGTVEAELPSADKAWDLSYSYRARKIVTGIFTAHGLLHYKRFQLVDFQPYEILVDGSRVVIEQPEDQIIIISGTAEIPVYEPPPPLTNTDSRSLAALLARYLHTDRLLEWMVSTFQMSAARSEQELWLLYGIRDAVATHFNGGKAAQSHLALNRDEWDLIGKIANSRPSNYSRHGGKFYDRPDSVTEEDRIAVRKACLRIIERYLDWLSEQHRVDP